MPPAAVTPEESLLREALDLAAQTDVRLIGREPLGAGTVAGFEVHDSSDPLIYYVDTSRRAVERETGLAAAEATDPEVRVWLHPADPHLPALAPLAFAHAAETLLARLGMHALGVPEIVAYRPGRRAVLRVPTDAGDVWVKAVPPARAPRLAATHDVLSRAGIPLPELLGWSDRGVLALASAVGAPVAAVLGHAGAAGDAHEADVRADALLDEVDRLRSAFAGTALHAPARTRMRRRLEWYAERLAATEHPGRTATVRALRDRTLARWGRSESAVIHGDLHFGQLFVDAGGAITGVIDVDTAGVGDPADDPAAFIAHAVASAVLTPQPRGAGVWRLAERALARWAGDPGMGDRVAARTTTHLLGHALGAVEAGEADRAALLLGAADAVLTGDLAALSSTRDGADDAPKSRLTAPLDRV